MSSRHRMRTAVVASLLSCCVVVVAIGCRADVAAAADGPPDVVVFRRDGCPRCAEAERFLETLRREQPALRIETHDVVREPDAAARLRALLDRRGVKPLLVPSFLVGDELVVGFRADVSERELRTRLAAAAGRGGTAAPSASPAARATP